jgi:hypothetical protein
MKPPISRRVRSMSAKTAAAKLKSRVKNSRVTSGIAAAPDIAFSHAGSISPSARGVQDRPGPALALEPLRDHLSACRGAWSAVGSSPGPFSSC